MKTYLPNLKLDLMTHEQLQLYNQWVYLNAQQYADNNRQTTN